MVDSAEPGDDPGLYSHRLSRSIATAAGVGHRMAMAAASSAEIGKPDRKHFWRSAFPLLVVV